MSSLETTMAQLGIILDTIKSQKETMELLSSIEDVYVQTWALSQLVVQMRTAQMFAEHIEKLSAQINVLEARTSFLSSSGVEE